VRIRGAGGDVAQKPGRQTSSYAFARKIINKIKYFAVNLYLTAKNYGCLIDC
jgi:hypothetical protein